MFRRDFADRDRHSCLARIHDIQEDIGLIPLMVGTRSEPPICHHRREGEFDTRKAGVGKPLVVRSAGRLECPKP